MWRQAIEAMRRGAKPSRREWYRRPEVWLILAAILVPFGWVPALCRFAWTYGAARRDRRNQAASPASTRRRSESDHTSP
jgi:hypothetical protein